MKSKRITKKMLFFSVIVVTLLGSLTFQPNLRYNEIDDDADNIRSGILFAKPAGPPGQDNDDDQDSEEGNLNIIIVVLIIIIIIAAIVIVALVYLLWKEKKGRSGFEP